MDSSILSQQRCSQLIQTWRTDPIDVWRIRQRQQQFVTYGQRHDQARIGQSAVQAELARRGHLFWTTSHKSPIDLVLANVCTVEIKYSGWHMQSEPGRSDRGRYQFNVRPHQTDLADFVILVLKNSELHYFVIPTRAITSQSITIRTWHPQQYTGKYSQYYQAWSQLDIFADWCQLNFFSLTRCPNCGASDQPTDGRYCYCGICLEITELEH